MLQHGVSGLGSLVSNASVKVLDALCVRAGTTEEDHAILVSTNAVHIVKSTAMSSNVDVTNITFWRNGALLGCCTNALGTARHCPSMKRSLKVGRERRAADLFAPFCLSPEQRATIRANIMKNIKFVVRVSHGITRAPAYVQRMRINRTPVQMTTNRSLALMMGRFTAEDAVKSIQTSRCNPELVAVQVNA
jgi:hypothetical protein